VYRHGIRFGHDIIARDIASEQPSCYDSFARGNIRPDQVSFELMREGTGICETRENIFLRQPRVLIENVRFRLASRQQFQDELDSQPCPPNDGLPRQNFGIDGDALSPRHALS
jgi:hypothetical protein